MSQNANCSQLTLCSAEITIVFWLTTSWIPNPFLTFYHILHLSRLCKKVVSVVLLTRCTIQVSASSRLHLLLSNVGPRQPVLYSSYFLLEFSVLQARFPRLGGLCPLGGSVSILSDPLARVNSIRIFGQRPITLQKKIIAKPVENRLALTRLAFPRGSYRVLCCLSSTSFGIIHDVAIVLRFYFICRLFYKNERRPYIMIRAKIFPRW